MYPEGIQSSSPGLVFFSQPWERQNQEIQPRRGCVSDRQAIFKNRHNPFQGCEFDFFAPLTSAQPQGLPESSRWSESSETTGKSLL